MRLRELLHSRINAKNFQGIVIRVGDKSEVNYWNPGDPKIYKMLLDIEIENPVSFNCVEGELKILDV